MHKIRYNLSALKLELEYQNKREYTWKQLAERMEISERTLSAWLHNRTSRIDMEVLEKALDFFHEEGMVIEFKDFFIVTNEPTTNENTKS